MAMNDAEDGRSKPAGGDAANPVGRERPGPILLMGDSITFAWGEFSARPAFANRGVPGQTTVEMRDRFEQQLEEVGAGGVHVLGGVNDIAGNGGPIPLDKTRDNLMAMCALAHRRGLPVWLGSVLPVAGIWWAPAVRDAGEQVAALNHALRADAQALGVEYVDYHRLLASDDGRLRPGFGTDGVHLSPEGYAVITQAALAAFAMR